MTSQQMTMFPELPSAAEEQHTPVRPAPGEVKTEAAVKCKCGLPATYLFGSGVYCGKCVVKTLRGQGLLTKTASVPVIRHCADGFRRVRQGGVPDYRPCGESGRVHPCKECKRLFPIHWLWTGEPAMCPACAAEAFRALYPDGVQVQ
jgi:hypothetical protein